VLGRVDDMLVVRGVNIYPSGIEAVLRRFPEVDEFKVIVTKTGELDQIELELECPEESLPRIEQALADSLHLRVPARSVPMGSLPRFELKARRLLDLRKEES
jgi:phenylacetate-CoA ligase